MMGGIRWVCGGDRGYSFFVFWGLRGLRFCFSVRGRGRGVGFWRGGFVVDVVVGNGVGVVIGG